MGQIRATPEAVRSLHRHFLTCDLMKGHADQIMTTHLAKDLVPGSPKFPDFFAYLSLWYATLYVALDGWRQLDLPSDKVQRVLADDHMQLLADFRNVTLHYRPKYIEPRTFAFIANDDAVAWVREAHDSLGEALLYEITVRMG